MAATLNDKQFWLWKIHIDEDYFYLIYLIGKNLPQTSAKCTGIYSGKNDIRKWFTFDSIVGIPTVEISSQTRKVKPDTVYFYCIPLTFA